MTGSCAEYGLSSGKISEKNKTQTINGLSKYKIKIYNHIKNNFSKKIKITWMRLFYVYGKSQRKNALIPYLLNCVKNKRNIYLGEPYSARDFINVKDVCEAIVLFIKNPKSGIFNVGSGVAYNPLNIVNMISKNYKLKIKLDYDKKSKKTKSYANINKIKKLGWKPKSSLKEYLK